MSYTLHRTIIFEDDIVIKDDDELFRLYGHRDIFQAAKDEEKYTAEDPVYIIEHNAVKVSVNYVMPNNQSSSKE